MTSTAHILDDHPADALVYQLTLSNPRPSGKAGVGELDVPVEFGGLTLHPGAMLYSDDDGIAVLI